MSEIPNWWQPPDGYEEQTAEFEPAPSVRRQGMARSITVEPIGCDKCGYMGDHSAHRNSAHPRYHEFVHRGA